jgi:hypothetical protein
MPEVPTVAAHGPYEDLGIKALEVLEKIIDGQPPEVRKQCWQWFIEDVKAWRELWHPQPSRT